jgi:ATP-dependent Clp protease adaptor protein ClpS
MAATIEETKEHTGTVTAIRPRTFTRPKRQPAYHVILKDDDDHTYEYVIGMLGKLFGHTDEQAYQLATEVDESGRVIVDTTTLERAELKRDQIHAFGRDWRLPRCDGSMTADIEPNLE